jgi:hypothetical protein
MTTGARISHVPHTPAAKVSTIDNISRVTRLIKSIREIKTIMRSDKLRSFRHFGFDRRWLKRVKLNPGNSTAFGTASCYEKQKDCHGDDQSNQGDKTKNDDGFYGHAEILLSTDGNGGRITPTVKYIIRSLAAPLIIFCTAQTNAASAQIPFEQCFREAGARYSVEPALLMAIADVESSFRPTAVNARSETDKDIGLMQIWSNWLPKLAEFNIGEHELLHDPCININVGAWILSHNFASHGISLTSLGAYNAGFRERNEKIRQTYVAKVIPRLHYFRQKLAEGTHYGP